MQFLCLLLPYIASFIFLAIVALPERHPCFSFTPRVFFSPAGCLPKFRTKRLRKETTFPKKEKKEAKGSFRVLKKTSSSPLGVEKNLHPTGSIFLHKLAFWKPFTDENGFLFSLFLLEMNILRHQVRK